MQVLGDFELDAELGTWPRRNFNVLDRSGFGPRHPDDRPFLQASDLREFGIQRELSSERHLAVADHEETDREQQQTAEDEDTDAHQAGRLYLHPYPPPSDRMKAATSGLSDASRSAAVPCARMRPSSSIASSSATTRALGMLCVTTTSVVP